MEITFKSLFVIFSNKEEQYKEIFECKNYWIDLILTNLIYFVYHLVVQILIMKIRYQF